MLCPGCKHLESKVLDSRVSPDGSLIRRRRACLACEKRFTTYEKIEENLPLVIKKDGRREPFNPQKLLSGIQTACEKRAVSIEQIESLVSQTQNQIQELAKPEVSSKIIGEMVMQALHQLDPVAYVRFASVYRSFKDAEEFMHELSQLLKSGNKK